MSKKVEKKTIDKENPALNFVSAKPKAELKKIDRMENINKLRMYTLTELEPVIGVTHRTLLEYVKRGRIKAVKIGGKWKLSEANLMKFLNGEEQ